MLLFRRLRGLAVICLVMSGSALAWPVDWIHDVPAGKEKFLRVARVDWVEIEDPSVAEIDVLKDTDELMISGLKPGRTLVLLSADGVVAAWLIRVDEKPLLDDAKQAAAKKACPTFKIVEGEQRKLAVNVATEACRQALLSLFTTDAFEARSLDLTFDGAVLQTQLKALQSAVKTKVKTPLTLKYVGAGLVLEGTLSQKEHRAMLWELLRKNVGRFALDDHIEQLPQPDAGLR